MLKRHRLLSQDTIAVIRKPQYKAYDEAKDAAVEELVNWFSDEFKIHRYNGRILADEIVSKVIEAKQKAIHPTAPDVYLDKRYVVEGIVIDSKALAEEMDEQNELEKILADRQNREDAEKHGL